MAPELYEDHDKSAELAVTFEADKLVTPKQESGVYSSAPISGFVRDRVSPSKSVANPKGVPALSARVPAV